MNYAISSLKYFPAYLIEYFAIYNDIRKTGFINRYNVLSIGAGTCVDYGGLYFALDRDLSKIHYVGYDIINWSYIDNFGNRNFEFINEDILSRYQLERDDHNVIIFPKSIGEFNHRDFDELCQIIENSDFVNDRIVLVSAMRASSINHDTDRFVRIVEIFKNQFGFVDLDPPHQHWYYNENYYLSRISPGFSYPSHIIDYVRNLGDYCPVCVDNGRSCYNDCDNLNRYPITKCKHIRYQIVRLERT